MGKIRTNQKHLRGDRRKLYSVRLEPGLIYKLTGLARAKGISVASILEAGAKAELTKTLGSGMRQ